MSKKSNMKYQASKELKKEIKYGESKEAAKKEARRIADATGNKYVPPRGIYSTSTYNNYKESCDTFIHYCIEHHTEVKTFADCERYVGEYIDNCRERNLSEWSINKYGYALCCAYHKTPEEIGFTKGVRSRADIHRCRDAAETNKLRQNSKYDDVVKLCTATGCRHTEMLRLRPSDFREKEDGNIEVFKRGKGGIERWCLVNPKYTEFVRDYVKYKDTVRIGNEDRLFSKKECPSKLALHDCRSYYACDLYNYYLKAGYGNGQMYCCRKELAGYHYDKGVLDKVSFDLQHSRDNVVIDYLWAARN